MTITIRIRAAKIRAPLEDPMESFICCENAALPVNDTFTPGGGLEVSTRLCRLLRRFVFALSESPSFTSTLMMVIRFDWVYAARTWRDPRFCILDLSNRGGKDPVIGLPQDVCNTAYILMFCWRPDRSFKAVHEQQHIRAYRCIGFDE